MRGLSLGGPVRLALAAAPAALIVPALGFAAGGYLPGVPELVLAALLLGVGAWVMLAPRPLAAFGPALVIAVVAMSIYCAWVLVSVAWSDADARAVLDFDRAVLYLAALVAGGLVASSLERMRWVVRALLVGGAVVCVAAFLSRALPDVFPTAVGYATERLSYPLTYWNNLGLLAAVTLILAGALACDRGESLAARALAAAAAPVLVATLVLTFGRGPVAAAIAGLAVMLLAGLNSGTLAGIVAIGPSSFVSARAALDADLLAGARPTSSAAVEQGHDLALVVALAAAGAAVLVVLLRPAERRVPGGFSPRYALGGAAILVVGAVVAALLAGATGFIERSYEEFTSDPPVSNKLGSERFTRFENNGRLDQWEIALEEFERDPLTGQGPGTYEMAWERDRPASFQVRDAHSLYVEQLAELGVVGLALLLVVLGSIGAGFARRCRGRARPLYAGLLGAGVAWALEAGIDWSWEMPAVTAWLFFAGGAALARPDRAPVEAGAVEQPADRADRARSPGLLGRTLVALALIALCVLPLRAALSQERLDDAVAAFERDDCAEAVDRALSSLTALGARPEPYAVLGYCDARLGEPRLGVEMMSRAVELEPRSWQYHYGLALLRALAGLDPQPELRRARELNPRAPVLERAATELSGDPQSRRRAAEALPLPRI